MATHVKRTDFGQRLFDARKRARLTQEQAAKAVGMSQSTLNGLERSGSSSGFTAQLAKLYGCDADNLATGAENTGFPLHPVKGSGGAQVDLSNVTIPTQIAWGDLMNRDLPGLFETVAPDDALLPEVRAGDKVKISMGAEPRPNDGILIRDAAGHHYLRRYRLGRAGAWVAFSHNPGFAPMDPSTDGIVVLGVVSIERRLSE